MKKIRKGIVKPDEKFYAKYIASKYGVIVQKVELFESETKWFARKLFLQVEADSLSELEKEINTKNSNDASSCLRTWNTVLSNHLTPSNETTNKKESEVNE